MVGKLTNMHTFRHCSTVSTSYATIHLWWSLDPDYPMYDNVQHYLESNSTSLTDIKHAAKLTALKLV